MTFNRTPTLRPALCRSQNNTYFVTNHLYETAEDARKDLGPCFVNLVTEWPAVLKPEAPAPVAIPKRFMPRNK